jgi:putative ABC transport system permease protein
VIGFDPDKSALKITEVNQHLDRIKIPDVVLFDRNSRPEFGSIAAEFEKGNTEQNLEIFAYIAATGYRVRVGGLFTLGPSFGVDGNLIVSDSTFLRIFQGVGRKSGMIDVGLVALKPGAKPQKILANLKVHLPKDVQIFTRQGFIDFEKDYWATRTPIGFTLNLMLTMGSIVGVVIVYQILYSNISNQLVAYATLKAIGYGNNYLYNVVFQQAFILAVLSYIPAYAICLGLYDFAMQATKLPIMMSLHNAIMVLISTILMCMTSGALAINQLRSTDPADIF